MNNFNTITDAIKYINKIDTTRTLYLVGKYEEKYFVATLVDIAHLTEIEIYYIYFRNKTFKELQR